MKWDPISSLIISSITLLPAQTALATLETLLLWMCRAHSSSGRLPSSPLPALLFHDVSSLLVLPSLYSGLCSHVAFLDIIYETALLFPTGHSLSLLSGVPYRSTYLFKEGRDTVHFVHYHILNALNRACYYGDSSVNTSWMNKHNRKRFREKKFSSEYAVCSIYGTIR